MDKYAKNIKFTINLFVQIVGIVVPCYLLFLNIKHEDLKNSDDRFNHVKTYISLGSVTKNISKKDTFSFTISNIFFEAYPINFDSASGDNSNIRFTDSEPPTNTKLVNFFEKVSKNQIDSLGFSNSLTFNVFFNKSKIYAKNTLLNIYFTDFDGNRFDIPIKVGYHIP